MVTPGVNSIPALFFKTLSAHFYDERGASPKQQSHETPAIRLHPIQRHANATTTTRNASEAQVLLGSPLDEDTAEFESKKNEKSTKIQFSMWNTCVCARICGGSETTTTTKCGINAVLANVCV